MKAVFCAWAAGAVLVAFAYQLGIGEMSESELEGMRKMDRRFPAASTLVVLTLVMAWPVWVPWIWYTRKRRSH